jgi:hypothetical protein
MKKGRMIGSDANRPNVRFGSKADMCSAKGDVRFTPESGHVRRIQICTWLPVYK